MFRLLWKAPARFRKSFGYCRDALAAMFAKEESFRLETIAFVVLAVVLLASGWPWWKRVVLAGTYLLVPLVEALNSAIEDVCDLVTRDQNDLVKNAKDKGALAVLLAIIINAFILAALLIAED